MFKVIFSVLANLHGNRTDMLCNSEIFNSILPNYSRSCSALGLEDSPFNALLLRMRDEIQKIWVTV